MRPAPRKDRIEAEEKNWTARPAEKEKKEANRAPSRLWLCLLFPELSLELFQRGTVNNEPLLIYQNQGNRQRVHAVNPAATQAGIKPGMTVSAARSLCNSVHLRKRDEAAEQKALENLAGWAGQFTSTTVLISPQPTSTHSKAAKERMKNRSRGLLLEIGGSLRLFGGIAALQKEVTQRIAPLGYQLRSAIAPTPSGASLLALAGHPPAVTELPALAALLRRLSLSLLALPEKQLKALHGMGLRRTGDLLRLPRAGLRKRLGAEVVDYLDRAFGKQPDPRECYEPPARFESHLPLPFEIKESDALLFAAHRLLLELSGFLLARQSAAQSLLLELTHCRQPPTRLTIGLVKPSREAEHFSTLLREQLERHPLSAPVETITLYAEQLIPLDLQSRDLFTAANPTQQEWPQWVERLQARLGESAVQSLCLAADHRPERAWKICSPGTSGPTLKQPLRPQWLLSKPILLKEIKDKPQMNGEIHLSRGPERIESGWWEGDDRSRDYFIAETSLHERLWIYRELQAPQRWFLHGFFA